jgi:mono/diheme cytochrome c family protein
MTSSTVSSRISAARLGAGLCSAVLCFALAACGGSESGTQPAAGSASDQLRQATETAQGAAGQAGQAAEQAAGAAAQAASGTAQAVVQQVAAAAVGCEVPSGDLRGTPDSGKQVYGMYCATCHGQGGKGDGPAAPASPKPADHTDPGRMGDLTDQDIYKVIKCGGASVGKSPLMTPWGPVLNDQQIRDTLAFVRSLSKT